jgi:hypothetical protein
MQIEISPALNGPITADEIKATKGMQSNMVRGVNIERANVAQLDQLIAYFEDKVSKARAALDDANRFRPSYAPAGRPTKQQSGAKAVLESEMRWLRWAQWLRKQQG